jgi:hypothetical protein
MGGAGGGVLQHRGRRQWCDTAKRIGEGGWPSSPRMADSGGNGGVRRGPEPLGHRWWTGGIEGGWWRRECGTQAWTRGMEQKRGTTTVDAFYGGPMARAKRKKAGDPGVRRRVQGKMGKREGVGAAWDSSAAGIGPRPAWLCRDKGERWGATSPARAQRTDGAGQSWGQWQRLGAGGSERERGSGGGGR